MTRSQFSRLGSFIFSSVDSFAIIIAAIALVYFAKPAKADFNQLNFNSPTLSFGSSVMPTTFQNGEEQIPGIEISGYVSRTDAVINGIYVSYSATGRTTGLLSLDFQGVMGAPLTTTPVQGQHLVLNEGPFHVEELDSKQVYDPSILGKGVVMADAATTTTMPPSTLWSTGNGSISVAYMFQAGDVEAYDNTFVADGVPMFNESISMPVSTSGPNADVIALDLAAAFPATNVPEPVTMSTLLIGGLPLLARRRRQF